jgi:aryl-alcohol dehydrogenase-like predicted oxidoreductase
MTASSPIRAPQTSISLGQFTVAPMAWGMWRFRGDDVAAARALVEAALEAGFNLLDTADIYGPDNGEPFGAAEALLGRVLAEAPQPSRPHGACEQGRNRDGDALQLFARVPDAGGRGARSSHGLKRIELYQNHRPDRLTHQRMWPRRLERLRERRQDRRRWACRTTPAAQDCDACRRNMPFPIAAGCRSEFTPLWDRAPERTATLDQAQASGHGVLACSPLPQGRLGGQPDR